MNSFDFPDATPSTDVPPAASRYRAQPSGFRRRELLAGTLAVGATSFLGACAAGKSEGQSDPDPLTPVDIQDDTQTETPETVTPLPTDAALMTTGSFRSVKMRGRETRWVVSRPKGVTGVIPVVIALHAYTADERTAFDGGLQIQRYLQQVVDQGHPPFAIASADAARSYYHPRTDGTDGGAMILDEFIPLLAANKQLELKTDKVGFIGWSMGGYGALRLGSILGPQRTSAIVASSPALWGDKRTFPPRAFDNPHDYDNNSLFGRQDSFSQIPLLIEVGASDQFLTYNRQWIAGLRPPPAFSTTAGGHNNRYWRTVLPEQLIFLSRELHR